MDIPNKSSKNIKDCHEKIQSAWPKVLYAFEQTYPGYSIQLDYTFRTPADQFEIFKKGRTLTNGAWVVTGPKCTDDDGTIKKSHHNTYPSQAADWYVTHEGHIIWPDKDKEDVTSMYEYISDLWVQNGLIGGATWKFSWKDYSHVQVAYNII